MRIFLLSLIAVLAPLCDGQMVRIPGPGGKAAAGGGPITYTIVHHTFSADTCPIEDTTCTMTIPSTTAGNLIVVFAGTYHGTNNAAFSSITGETGWTRCFGSTNTIVNVAASVFLYTDCAYTLAAAGGVTSLTWNWANSAVYKALFDVVEVSRSSGTWALDASNAGTDSACTSCAGQALTLSGSDDIVFQYAATQGGPTFTAITDSYTGLTDASINSFNVSLAVYAKKNASAVTQPTWTTSSSEAVPKGAIAFK